MIRTWAVLSLVFLSACGDPGAGWEGELEPIGRTCQKIMDGALVTDEAPTVQVQGCTGVYVADGVVLTAAHCGNPAWVQTGVGPTIRSNILWVPHPDWNGGPEHDLALIFLDGPLPLPIATLGAPHEGPALAQGYGLTETGELEGLRERDVEIVGEREGRIIATEATCYGDSGGPLYQDGKLVGITRGGENGDCRGLGDFTRLDTHLGWLQSEAEITFAGGC